MSSLVNDFLIEPVLRRARNFSRSNVDTIQKEQSTSPNHISIATENPAIPIRIEEPLDVATKKESDLGEENSLNSHTTRYSSVQEEDGLENASQERESIRLSSIFVSSQNANLSQEINSIPDIETSSIVISDDLSLDESIIFSPDTSISTTVDPIDENLESSTSDLIESNNSRSELLGNSTISIDHPRTMPLPEDDGMGQLRRQIISIQAMDIKPERKARLMHQLLTRNYSKAQKQSNARKQRKILSPSTVIKQKSSAPSGSISSFLWQLKSSLDSAMEEQNYTYRLFPDDIKPTYVPLVSEDLEDNAETGSKEEFSILGCKHYRRNVKLQCSACEKWYTCRLCHDEAEDHVLDRKATKNMLCMLCGYAQKAGEFCVECGKRTAWYYCNICKLWDNDPNKSIYHCHDCGICRKGMGIGKDFFHCKKCGVCMSMSVEHSHKCIERVSDCDCPICGEYMFSSPTPVVFMLCGHGIHKACYEEYLKTSYKCPICSKSTKNMETQFRNLDLAVASQPMPPKFRDTKALVSCNDCCAKSAVTYHWLGLKCAICDSYNTNQLFLLSGSTGGNSNQVGNINDDSPPNLGIREDTSPPIPVTNMIRRRHSSYINSDNSNDHGHHRNLSAQGHRRTSRSTSTLRGLELPDEEIYQAIETDDSGGEEDELDFWGLDEPRSVTSGENDEEIEEDESDEDSILEDCDDDGEDEEDEFALFGHR
ncbi:putative chy zinc finger [Erysiphe neolycopersici]|uniref:Putative chy zinc finger n=1 Tax=Erysiphe neolycopersici TaxID=212602 RepID=A0A420I367_9PEZI|nr:putative chy zinc finger [Erysiphe neolycopersici]